MRRNYIDSGSGTVKIRDNTIKKRVSKPRIDKTPKYMQKKEIDICLKCPLPDCRYGNCNLIKE